ncbi:MAG: pilus assembly protein [Armatimonadetes bacterium]|nr:pilus assembly protein [Armatimonadota bacterium]PIX45497.1 MAG: hypothetical protein COZ56_01735 [Armatimonadetes bacterium CG_4_8_14_3_um_filter_58_9]
MQKRTSSNRPSGQTLIEFALIVPLLMLLIMGIMAFGQMLSHQVILNNAAREGARTGVVCATDPEIDAAVRKTADSLPHYSDPNYLEIYIDPKDNHADRVFGKPLLVQLRYKDNVAVPILGMWMNPKILMARKIMTIENCAGGLDPGNGSSSTSSSSSGGSSSGGNSNSGGSSGSSSSGGSNGHESGAQGNGGGWNASP